MKITKIELNDYLNFKKKIAIDLTYPLDHPEINKRGKPLEKICFIGPSGTGKTTILNLIKFFSFEDDINPDCLDQNLLKDENVGVHFLIGNSYKCSKWSTGNKGDSKKNIETLENIELIYKGENSLTNTDCKRYIKEHFFKNDKVKLVSFPFDAIRDFYSFDEVASANYSQAITKPEDEKKGVQQVRKNYLEKKVWDFGIDNIKWIWEIYADVVNEYEPDYSLQLNKFLSKSNEDSENQPKYYQEFKSWEKENENPLKKHVKNLDAILSKFNLKIDTEIVHGKKEIQFPRIKQLNSKIEVPTPFLSTGTVQLLVTTLPLSILNIDSAVILFDEPERSLFPDTQLGLISTYTSFVPNSQIFFATHSPIIASAFDPCERIILFLNEEGNIDYRKGNSPEGDDPNDMLHKDFGMSNILEKKGVDSLKKFISLKTEIENETDETKKEALMCELMEINDKYRFSFSK